MSYVPSLNDCRQMGGIVVVEEEREEIRKENKK
jgi:hypothetical protein